MKNIHVRLEYAEALEGKKELLSSQLNLLEILRKLKTYKTIRKRELILKDKLKKELTSLKKEITNIETYLPEEEKETKKAGKTRKKPGEIEKGNINKQLQEIQEKLAKLQ